MPDDFDTDPPLSVILRRRRLAQRAHPALIIVGYFCALFSLVIFPPALGLAGCIFGTVCLFHRATINGVIIVILSLVFATIGMIWGAEVVLFGRPQFLIGTSQ